MPTTTLTCSIRGMHCASCAALIERTIKKDPSVKDVSVNFATETAELSFDASRTDVGQLSKKVEPFGYRLTERHLGDPHDHGHGADSGRGGTDDHSGHAQGSQAEVSELEGKVKVALPIVAVTVAIMVLELTVSVPYWLKEFLHHLLPVMATYVLFVTGQQYLKGVITFLRHGVANMDTLIGIGTLAAFLYSFTVSALEDSLKSYLNTDQLYYDVTVVVIGLVTLGKYLEARSKLKTGAALKKLLGLQAKTATVIRGNAEVDIPVPEVVVGDLVVVKPGAKVPIDGTITEGESHVDESMVSGEPMPAKKGPGDSVIGGTLNREGRFVFKTTKVGKATLLSQIIALVASAQASKAPIQKLADRISAVFVPTVLALAFITLVLWLTVGLTFLPFDRALTLGLTSFVGILVIACPCALGLATPLGIIVGVGKGAEHGILVKNAAALEKLHGTRAVVVDKTGTVTRGTPELLEIKTTGNLPEVESLKILASLEAASEHPIAHAVVQAAKERGIRPPQVEHFESLGGRGVSGTVNGTTYLAGSLRLMEERGVTVLPELAQTPLPAGTTPVYLAAGGLVLARAAVGDQLKPEAKEAVATLRRMNVRVIMLTGDHKPAAEYMASQVGITEVEAGVLPQDKAEHIKRLQAQGLTVAMAGDGINDAPALAQADIGVAMSTGTDIAMESADVTLLHGDLSKLAQAIKLSRLTMRNIKQNLFWAFAYNVVGIPLAAGLFYPIFGWSLSPVFAGAAMALSSLSVSLNALRLKTLKL